MDEFVSLVAVVVIAAAVSGGRKLPRLATESFIDVRAIDSPPGK
jgi:hypothetical protein